MFGQMQVPQFEPEIQNVKDEPARSRMSNFLIPAATFSTNLTGTRHGLTEFCAATVQACLSTVVLGIIDDSSFTARTSGALLPLLQQYDRKPTD